MLERRRKKAEKRKAGFSRELFTLSYWRHNYFMVTVLLFTGIFIYRGTMDGLMFIAAATCGFAWRLTLYKKEGFPLKEWEKEKKTLREFGYARAFETLTFPYLFVKIKNQNIQKAYNDVMMAYCIFTIFLLHICIAIIIVFHNLFSLKLDELFFSATNHFNFIFDNWPSYTRVHDGLTLHGYENRIPIIRIVYFTVVSSTIFLLISVAVPMCKYLYYRSYEDVSIYYYNVIRNKNSNKHILFINKICLLFIILPLCVFLLTLFLYNYLSLPIIYPGERLRTQQIRFSFMQSHAYKDDLGFFTLAYMIPLFSWFWFCGTLAFASLIFIEFRRKVKWMINLIKR